MRQRNGMGMRPRHQTSLKQKLFWAGAGGALILAGVLGVMNFGLDHTNEGLIVIKENEIRFLGGDLTNTVGAGFHNEGQTYYQGDIHNLGNMTCGNCETGSNYLNDQQDRLQSVDGTQPIQWHDAILDNHSGVELKNELSIINSFSFRDGALRTDRNRPNHFIHFKESAIYDGTTDERHIDGYAGRTGDGDFVFPVGDGNTLHPVQVSSYVPDDFVKVAYFRGDPEQAAIPGGGNFSRSAFDPELLTGIHDKGYWAVEGAGPASITLFWNQSDDLSDFVGRIDSLVVVGWNGQEWTNLGNAFSSGDIDQGSVTSDMLDAGEYQVYTFGKNTPSEFGIQLLTFRGEWQMNDGLLSWLTNREINSDYFVLERSIDSRVFEKIAEIPAAGMSDDPKEYDFLDEGIALMGIPVFFYRLKQVNLDGQFSYSHIVELEVREQAPVIEFTVFPNPAYSEVNIRFKSSEPTPFELKIMSINGQAVHSGMITNGEQLQMYVDKWATGPYYVLISNGDISKTKKLLIIR